MCDKNYCSFLRNGLIMEKILLDLGYIAQEYGFTKTTGDIVHWVTLFDVTNNSLQMYAYHKDDEAMEKVYDTGIISLSSSGCFAELQTLIKVLGK